MAEIRDVPWYEADRVVDGLATHHKHEIRIQREAIPLVFVPGIMGTRLRKAGTKGREGKTEDNLPNMRWDPSSNLWLIWSYGRKSPSVRKAMLIGETFQSNYLEVANDDPLKDGFSGIMEDYWKKFLKPALRKHKWGPLSRIFEFPVYSVGYNWTDDTRKSGKMLAERIKDIIKEAKAATGLCEKVIVITHSMGGLVTRWAVAKCGAADSVLGVIHGVQPVTGSPAAYYRVKAGFEALKWTKWIESWVLGDSGPKVTPILGNMPGGLQLLPNKSHVTTVIDPVTKRPSSHWLTVTDDGDVLLALPKKNPYEEIYRVPAEVRPSGGANPSTNKYWGLIDPDLLDPKDLTKGSSRPLGKKEKRSKLDAQEPAHGGKSPWAKYEHELAKAEEFHNQLTTSDRHPNTYCVVGTKQLTPDVIELRIEEPDRKSAKKGPYETREFRGQFRDASGKVMHAVLQEPAGPGDATVPESSAAALKAPTAYAPATHQPAFEEEEVQKITMRAIMSLCSERIREKRGSPKSSAAATGSGSGPKAGN